MSRLLLHLSTLTVLSATAHAQRTWVVDAYGGAGTDFRELAAAMTAAADGDTIRIRFGAYHLPTETSKALTLLGENHPLLIGSPWFLVAGLPADRVFTVKGVRLYGFLAIRFLACAGRIHLDDVQLGAQGGNSLEITDCRYVTLNQCTLTGIGGLGLLINGGSAVVLGACTVTGRDNPVQLPGFDLATEGLAVQQRSLVVLGHTSVRGGVAINPLYPSRPALSVADSRVEISGDATTSLQAGAAGTGIQGAAAIAGNATATLLVDPRLTLRPSGPNPAVSGFRSVDFARTSTMRAGATGPGGSIVCVLQADPGDAAIVLLGAAVQPLFVDPVGYLFADPTALYLAAAGLMGTAGVRIDNVGIPAHAPPGATVSVQALVAGTGLLRLTVPAFVVLD